MSYVVRFTGYPSLITREPADHTNPAVTRWFRFWEVTACDLDDWEDRANAPEGLS